MRSGAWKTGLKVLAVATFLTSLNLAAAAYTGKLATPATGSWRMYSRILAGEDAKDRLPLDGTAATPITWDVPEHLRTDPYYGVLIGTAQRGLAFLYWQWGAADWTPIIPHGRYLHDVEYHEQYLQPFAGVTDFAGTRTGPLWVTVMGVDDEKVTFCSDHGYWLGAADPPGPRPDRAHLGTFTIREQTGPVPHNPPWVVHRYDPLDAETTAKYRAQCTAWARHRP